MEDYVLIFLVFTIVYTQGQNPYTSAIAFALLLLGIRYLLYKHKQKENKRNKKKTKRNKNDKKDLPRWPRVSAGCEQGYEVGHGRVGIHAL